MQAPTIRPQHNPFWLICPHVGCKKWFKSAGGRTKHVRLFHNEKVAMRLARSPSHAPSNDDPLDDPLINNDPLINDDLLEINNDLALINEDLPLNEPDLPFAHSPARNESPLQDETRVYHPLINGAYGTVIISCSS